MGKLSLEKMPSYGGQAIIEGVLMRGSHFLTAAMRRPDGQIEIRTEELKGIYKSRIRKVPLLRGLILLWDALDIGIKYLTISANIQTGEEEKIEGPALYLSLGVSLVFGISLFFLLPAAGGHWLEKGFSLNPWWSNVIEGIFRLFLIIAYLIVIGKMKDISRVFGYHGAEHKTINAYETGLNLSPVDLRNITTQHPRCGTSFLLTLILVSIIVFSLLGPLPILWRLLSRIILLPLLAGIAYEYLKWTSARMNNPFIRWLVSPNLALQKLTTREPSDDMVEVSIAAFQNMLEHEKQYLKS